MTTDIHRTVYNTPPSLLVWNIICCITYITNEVEENGCCSQSHCQFLCTGKTASSGCMMKLAIESCKCRNSLWLWVLTQSLAHSHTMYVWTEEKITSPAYPPQPLKSCVHNYNRIILGILRSFSVFCAGLWRQEFLMESQYKLTNLSFHFHINTSSSSWVPHLEISPKHFTMTTIVLFSASVTLALSYFCSPVSNYNLFSALMTSCCQIGSSKFGKKCRAGDTNASS